MHTSVNFLEEWWDINVEVVVINLGWGHYVPDSHQQVSIGVPRANSVTTYYRRLWHHYSFIICGILSGLGMLSFQTHSAGARGCSHRWEGKEMNVSGDIGT